MPFILRRVTRTRQRPWRPAATFQRRPPPAIRAPFHVKRISASASMARCRWLRAGNGCALARWRWLRTKLPQPGTFCRPPARSQHLLRSGWTGGLTRRDLCGGHLGKRGLQRRTPAEVHVLPPADVRAGLTGRRREACPNSGTAVVSRETRSMPNRPSRAIHYMLLFGTSPQSRRAQGPALRPLRSEGRRPRSERGRPSVCSSALFHVKREASASPTAACLVAVSAGPFGYRRLDLGASGGNAGEEPALLPPVPWQLAPVLQPPAETCRCR